MANIRQLAPSYQTTRIFIFIALFMSLFLSSGLIMAQDGNIDYDITLNPTVVDTGETITYNFSSSCSGVTGGCTDFTINIDYDETLFEFVSSSIDSADGDAIITDNGSSFTVEDPSYGDGDGFTATVTLRALPTLTTGGVDIPTITTSSGTTGGVTGPTTPFPDDITINNPDLRYDVRKTQVLPSGIPPAYNDGLNGAYTRYNVQYCATQSTDVLPIVDAVLVDRLPDGVTLLNSSGADIVVQTSPPSAVAGTFLVWDIGDMNGTSGCISRTVEYTFPTSAGFNVNSDGTTTPSTTNTVYGHYNDRPTEYGDCVTDCVGTTTESPELDDPLGQPNVFKSVRDDRPLAFPGNNEFTFGFNTSALNVDMTNVIIGDTLPTEAGEPSTDVYEVSSGTWAGGLAATLRIIFEDGATDTFGIDGTGVTVVYGDAQTGGTAVVTGSVTSPSTTATRDVTPLAGNRITRVELEFPSVPQAFAMSGDASLLYTVNPDVVTSEITESNCAVATYTSPPNPSQSSIPQGCADAILSNDTSSVINYSKGASPSSVDNTDGVDDFIDFTITLEVAQQSSNSLTGDMTYTDTLPDALDFVAQNTTSYDTGEIPFTFSFVGAEVGDTVPAPYIRIVDSASDLLEFYWTTDVTTLTYPVYDITGVEYTSSGDAGMVANPINVSPPAAGTKDIIITYKARVKEVTEDTYAGTYTNNVTADAGSISLICDGASSETQTCSTSSNFSIIAVNAFEASKWVRSNFLPVLNVRADRLSYEDDSPQFAVNTSFACTTPIGLDEVLRNDTEPLPPDPSADPSQTDNNISADGVLYSRTPCVAQGNPGETFEYLIEITNRGNNQLNEFTFYDILPYIGDTGVNQAVAGVSRLSEFEVWLNGAVTIETPAASSLVPADFDIQYSTSTDPCRPEMSSGTGISDWQSCGSFVEDSVASTMTRDPRSFRIVQTNNSSTAVLDPDFSLIIRVPVYIPTTTDLTNAGLSEAANEDERALTGEIAWNSFAFRFRSESTGNLLLTASPRKVGIRIPERLSVGNRVWIDTGTNGGSNVYSDVNDRERDDITSDEQGVANVVLELYRYEGAGSIPSNVANVAPGSLTDVELVARTITDADGYYLFETDMRASPDTTDGQVIVNGITFPAIPTNVENAYDWIGDVETWSLRPGSYFIYIPPINFSDDYNNNGTSAEGPTDFGPLEGYMSSTGVDTTNGNSADDNRDRGIDTSYTGTTVEPELYGVISDWFDLEFYTDVNLSSVPLGTNDNPLNEDDVDVPSGETPPSGTGPYGRGTYHQNDQFSDLVRDFGFITTMSIGNRVWLDNGAVTGGTDYSQYNDGLVNGTEVGIENVTVNLYFEDETLGFVLADTTQTDNQGYYIFDSLPEGTYIVEIPTSEFTTGGDLVGFNSSFDVNAPVDGDPDNDDHGADQNDPTTNPIRSPEIILALGTEPTDPTPGDTTNGDDADDEAVTGTNGNTPPSIDDEDSDLTVDFGFVNLMSIGNRVWFDYGTSGAGFDPTLFDDGIRNGDELGVENVVVNLLFEGPSGFTQISSTTTDGTGYYIFDNLPPGDYIVEIPTSEFGSGEPLEGHYSSTDVSAPVDGDPDNDDHGIDVDPTSAPIRSPEITLTPAGELTTDDDEAVTGTNANTDPPIADNNSDLTVDFGFIRPMGLGNRVWEDIDRVTGILGDGTRQSTELGIGGVEIQLYADTDNSGDFDISLDTLVSITSTSGSGFAATNGYYLFDRMTEFNNRRLGQGDYFVHIPADQFTTGGALENYVNSNIGTSAAGTDTGTDSIIDGGDENGVNPTPGTTSTYPINAGVTSTEILLRYDTEPPATATTEGDFNPSLTANYNGENVEDDNGDLTIDFGFYQGLAVGNRVWYDSNRNGVIDEGTADDDLNPFNTNPGIPGVTVYLYLDDGTGTPTGTPLATDITDSEGYYLFDESDLGDLLLPDDYVVAIDYDLVSGLNAIPLEDMINTITRADASGNTLATAEDAEVDNDDNGFDQRDLGTTPTVIYSEVIALSHLDETVAEADADKETGGDGGTSFGDGNGVQDNNSDLTVDFGFFIPFSIGNRVWYDFGSGTPANNNNAVIDAGELGVDNVIVELFRGTSISGTPYRTTVTVSDGTTGLAGYYLFDDLPEGDYIVRLAPENFQPNDSSTIIIDGITINQFGSLTDSVDAPYSSSESGAPTDPNFLLDNQTDNNDNGIDENLPQTNGIVSNVITLSRNQEPDGVGGDENDTDLNTDVTTDGSPEGRFTEKDYNADMTVDFGVYAPLMSIGNLVFKDYDNDRIFNNVDEGVDGVVVNLFLDSNADGIPDSGINNPIATTQTDNGGFYIFDGLNAGTYLVQIDEVNFRTSGNQTLRDFYSSQDKDASNTPVPPTDNENDIIESGIDTPFSLANNPDLQAEGVFSPPIVLEPSGEFADEDITGGLGPEGDGEPNIQQTNSELTIDFGFYQPMSIGNVVWFDTDENGLFDGSEVGIAGVEVHLYRETDGNAGTLDIANDTRVQVFNGTSYDDFDITDSNGYYLFDNLLAGQYWVHIPAANFTSGVLTSHISTQTGVTNTGNAPAPNTDSNDNGIPEDTSNTTVGVTSESIITLGVDVGGGVYIPNSSEPVLEFDKSLTSPADPTIYDGPASIGRYGEIDANSDITIDFGFTLEDDSSMSIGNRVWFDANHDGLIDVATDDPANPGDPGIDNVVVLLYRADTSGNPIGNPIARDITSSDSGGNGGYYLFDVLDTDANTALGDGDGAGGPIAPGNYVVVIPNSNFAGGAPLENLSSTIFGADNTSDPATGFTNIVDDDNNNNGTSRPPLGIISNLITLTLNNERTDEGTGEPVGNKHSEDLDGTDASLAPIALENSDLTIDFGFYLPMSIGNFVWFDTNNDGIYDSSTEVPVDDGVTLTLYRDDGSGGFDASDLPVDDPSNPGNPYQVSTVDGFYLFENLPPGDDYIVVIDQSNFTPTAGVLDGYISSNNSGTFEDDTDDDNNDNGRDNADPFASGGIPSGIIVLEYGTEPETENTSGNPADGPNGRGNNGELDNNSNLTVDFGLFTSTYFSIGNRVWEDNGTNANNGILDSDELGIENVIMYLFRDEAGGTQDGVPDSITPIATTTTDASGYYLFDELPSGSYIVSVAPENFEAGGTLRGYNPTTPADASDSTPDDNEDNVTDQRDNPPNNAPDDDFGFYSNYYTLELTPMEPISPTESDPTPANATQESGFDPFGNPIPDDQSNLTVDFGFIRTLTIGNLVWFDLDQDGTYDDATEAGIAGVTVELYTDDDGNGQFDGTEMQVGSDITDGNGFYLFENVEAGSYLVHIPNDPNWTTGPLAGFESTQDANPGDSGDDNDNGIGEDGNINPTPGISSELLTIDFGTAPTGESTLSENPDDGPEFRGNNNPPDNNSDLTWDFGFFIGNPMSIGNIVWIDDGGPTGTGTVGDGIRNGDEEGVDDVIIELYRDDSDGAGGPPDGNPDTTTPLDTTTTDDGGYYIFDGLPPGNYIVVLPEDNFDAGAPLNGYGSTTTLTPDTDDNDNGEPDNGGVKSGTITLTIGGEPTDPTPGDPLNGDDQDSEDVTGTGSNGELDEDSNLTVDFGFIQSYDWGDAPDSYGTDSIPTPISGVSGTVAVGPSHRIVANLYLGESVDDETDGQPVNQGDSNNPGDAPAGDGTDEDGMAFPTFVAGTTVTVDVTAVNDTGEDATLIGWFDWNGDGVFDSSEAFEVSVPDGTDGIVQLEVTIPIDAEDLTGGDTYVRLRLTTDTITSNDPTGPMDSGEVEDYFIEVEDPGLLINKTDGLNSILAGTFNTYTIIIENSGDERIGVVFRDDIQVATDGDPNGYDPETVEWSCEGTNGGLCISNPASGTDGTTASDGPFDEDDVSIVINELIDLPRDGRVTYTITGRVNSQAGLDGSNTPLINLAELPNELPPLEDEDETAIIYDPPFGVKTGVLLDNDIIRWTMIWYNPGAEQSDVVITDVLNDNQSFPDTTAEIDLQCSGSDGACSIIGDDTVRWEGTMFHSTEDNDADAVIIAFNVLIDGDGRYDNDAQLSFTTTDVTAEASARVRVEDGEGTSEDPDDPGSEFTQPPPSLTKVVDTPFTLPGATVTWTIQSTNDTGNTIKNVSITDDVPADLTIIDATSSSGDLTVDGQTITVKQDNFFEGETITITVTTEISPDVALPFAINNPAVLRCDCSDDSNAIATILSVLELPATGESPWWRTSLILVIMSGLVLTSSAIVYRRRENHIN